MGILDLLSAYEEASDAVGDGAQQISELGEAAGGTIGRVLILADKVKAHAELRRKFSERARDGNVSNVGVALDLLDFLTK